MVNKKVGTDRKFSFLHGDDFFKAWDEYWNIPALIEARD